MSQGPRDPALLRRPHLPYLHVTQPSPGSSASDPHTCPFQLLPLGPGWLLLPWSASPAPHCVCGLLHMPTASMCSTVNFPLVPRLDHSCLKGLLTHGPPRDVYEWKEEKQRSKEGEGRPDRPDHRQIYSCADTCHPRPLYTQL